MCTEIYCKKGVSYCFEISFSEHSMVNCKFWDNYSILILGGKSAGKIFQKSYPFKGCGNGSSFCFPFTYGGS